MLKLVPMETSWWTDFLVFALCFGFGAVIGLIAVIVAMVLGNQGTAEFSPRERVVMSAIGFIIGAS